MMKSMGISARTSFNEFISDCLTQENNNNLYTMSKGRKRALESGPSQPRTPVMARPNFRPVLPGARFRPPQRKTQQQGFKGQKAFKVALPQAKAGQGHSAGNSNQVKGPCFNCDQMGHFAKYCPRPKRKTNVYPARAHHTTASEVIEGGPIMAGTFSVNDHPAVVLFDSGSSHSFMSDAFAHRYNQPSVECGHKYRISSAGADVLTNRAVRGATLRIEGRNFRAHLVVMPGLSLDVILGMNWMKEWDVILNTTTRILSLREPRGTGMFQVTLPRRLELTSVSFATQVTSLEEIPVVCEFPDVFPEDLPGLPPTRCGVCHRAGTRHSTNLPKTISDATQ